MKISDLFFVKYGVNLELVNCELAGESDLDYINFVSRTSENNGVTARVKPIAGIVPQNAGTISCAAGGSVLSTFLQTKPYYSGRDLYVLTPKKHMTIKEKLFWCYVINCNAYKYNYGRQANKTLKDIELPDIIPPWVEKASIKIPETANNSILSSFSVNSWEYFKIGELFKVSGTKTTSIDELNNIGKGVYPYVTTQASNNGVVGYYDYYTEDGNVLTIDSAVLGFCSYQAKSFSASDHVEKLTPNFPLNKYIAAFLCTILNKECFRYSYGRKFNQNKIRNTCIKLPSRDGNPDWEYMENYIKSLPYGDRI